MSDEELRQVESGGADDAGTGGPSSDEEVAPALTEVLTELRERARLGLAERLHAL